MKIPILKTWLATVFVTFSTAIFAQDVPKNIYELYKITKGGCSFQDIIDNGKPLSLPQTIMLVFETIYKEKF